MWPVSSELKHVLKLCRDKLILGISTNQILENSTMRVILGDVFTQRHIQEQGTSVQKNQQIWNHVFLGGLPAYFHFKKVLHDTRHWKLLSDLENAEKGLTEESSDLWPRIAEKALTKTKGMMKQYLDPLRTLDGISDTSEIIDEIRIRDIKEQGTSTERIKLLIQEVEKLGVIGYELLKKVLLDTGQNGLYDDLVRAERDSTKEMVASKDILEDYIGYKVLKEGMQYESSPRHKSNNKVMLLEKSRELCTEFERRYEAQFGKKMDHNFYPEISETSYFDVLNTVIENGIHWGQVVALISFAGTIAASHEKRGLGKDTVVKWTSKFLTAKVEFWVSDSGGWTSLIDFCNARKPISSTDDDGPRLLKNNTGQAPFTDDNDVTDGSEASMTIYKRPTSAVSSSSQIKTLAAHLIGIAGGFVMGMMIGKRS